MGSDAQLVKQLHYDEAYCSYVVQIVLTCVCGVDKNEHVVL